MNENGNYINMLKIAFKNLLNHIKWTLFLAGFNQMEPLCGTTERSATKDERKQLSTKVSLASF